ISDEYFGNTGTTKPVSTTIPTVKEEAEGQKSKRAVQPGIESTGQGNAEVATPVLANRVVEGKTENIKGINITFYSINGRDDSTGFAVEKNKDGYIIHSAMVPMGLQRNGIGTEFYKRMNKESISETGNVLKSSKRLSKSAGKPFWDKLVQKGLAKKIGEDRYEFQQPLKINQDDAENKLSESRLTEQDNPVQEPSIKAIESKAKSTNKAALNEVVRQVDKKINQATGVEIMNPNDLSTDEARFQGREGLDSDRVNEIAATYNPAFQDPIIVWKDKDGKTYVLSGHHRLAAALKLGLDKVKVQDVSKEFSEARAIKFAREEANLNRTNQTDLENAAILSRMKSEGRKADIKTFLGRLGKNKTFVDDISMLNPKGKAIEALRSVQKSDDKVTQRETERIAQWIGAARKLDSRLTNAHENEMFDFLLSGTRYKNKQDFLKTIAAKLGFDFNATEPLNLRRFKSDAENKFDEIKNDLENKISEKQGQIDNIKNRFRDTKRKDYIP
ncbi:MAG TPA: ParB N-terminal domain-containing protein, partial [Hanamia sp.]|nr:ParB N-terminal domain-containing protein [Hanamia sp.]